MLYAQDDTPKASLHVWSDFFGGNQGAVLYPQYAWGVTTPIGNFSGFGFIEVAPHEPLFTNHLAVYTPPQASWFSIHTETGGLPDKGLSFFQIGPRLNATAMVPKLKKPLHHLFITALPRFEGVRPNNILLAGATNRFKITNGLQGSIEGYRRFFPHRPDYAEYWFLVHPKATPHLSWSAFVLNDGSRVSVGFGARVSLF
jgi:hypothetical protein